MSEEDLKQADMAWEGCPHDPESDIVDPEFTVTQDDKEKFNEGRPVAPPRRAAVPITDHGGNKYIRTINAAVGVGSVKVDVYAVLKAFSVTCSATQHAIKKLLCAGLRGKASKVQDLFESIDAIHRAIEMAEDDEDGSARHFEELLRQTKEEK